MGRRGHVALTFDDGPDAASTPQFLDTLADLGWHATFFMLGEMTRRDPGLARAVADAGHEIGVHGDVHGNMLRRTPRHAADDIARVHETVTARDRSRALLVPPSVRHLVVRVVARRATARDDDRTLDHLGSRLATRGHARRRSSPTSPAATSTVAPCCSTTPTAPRIPGRGTRRSTRCPASPTSSPRAALTVGTVGAHGIGEPVPRHRSAR